MKRFLGHIDTVVNSRFALPSFSATRLQLNTDNFKQKLLWKKEDACHAISRRGVNTLSPLTAVFNSKPSLFVNFSIAKDLVGLFGVPELRSASGFYLMKQKAVLESEDLVAEGCSAHRKRKMVEVFDELSNVLCRVADLAEFVRLAHPDSQYQGAAQEAAFSIGALVEQLNVNRQLYDALRQAVEEGDVVPTTDVDQHVSKLFLFDFEQSGIHLDAEKRRKVFELNEYILALGQHFMSDCHNPRKIERSDLPPDLCNYLSMTGSSVTVRGLLSDSSSEGAREASYRVYQLPDHQQEVLLSRLLSSRRDMAQLCGFPSFAHRALRGSLAETPEMVGEFLEETSDAVRPLAAGDYDVMRDMKMRDNCANKVCCRRNNCANKVCCRRNNCANKVCCMSDNCTNKVCCRRNNCANKVCCMSDNCANKVCCMSDNCTNKVCCRKKNCANKVSYRRNNCANKVCWMNDNCANKVSCMNDNCANKVCCMNDNCINKVCCRRKNCANKLSCRNENCANELGMWDVCYYTALGKHVVLCGGDLSGARTTNISKAPNLSHYFPLGTVMEGLNSLLQQLYGVRLDLCRTPPGETWADDVHKLAVVEADGSILGHIYCDFSERAGKTNQDCHFTIRGGKVMPDGSYQTPCVVVQLTLPPASWSGPPLLTPGMVENLFHEMGHALHSMMARTRYQHVTGTRCSTDFAEVPSILMEYFASDPRVIQTFARHFKTGEPLPDLVLQSLVRSRAVFAASELQTQVYYAAVDQRYHSNTVAWETGVSTSDVLKEEHEKHYGLPYVENTAWQHRFSHFVGYGGKYYAYLVSRAVASWIWETYFQANPFSRDAGERYRREVLQHGGGVPPRILVEGFLHRELTPHNLSRALMTDLDRKKTLLHG
ncbi:Peptidase M3A/M3B catalytic domain [Trinorchestia longiramus]|nr:Peptidase M3A/M3B catalytic domain [Trinorchestia longiramus]